MKRTPPLFLTAVALGLLAWSSSVDAASLKPQLVSLGSTFSFDVVASNPGTGAAFYVVPPENATFGSTTVYPAVGVDGQTITITSSEAIGATTTTDTITVSTPSNFLTDATLAGSATLNNMQFDIGNINSATGSPATAKPVTLTLPIASFTNTGNTIIGTNTNANITPVTTLAGNGMSFSAVEGLMTSPNSLAISSYSVHNFSYSITYSNIPAVAPEPSTWAMLGVGAIAGAWMIRRRYLAA